MIERRSLYEEETTELPLLRIETRSEDGQPESRWIVGYAAKFGVHSLDLGEEVIGQYPLKLTHNGSRKATFILRENATPIYLNPTPTYRHTINRKAKAEIMPRFKPFIDYVEVMSKLSADETQYSPWSTESRDNPRLPSGTIDERTAMGLPNHGSLRWSHDKVPEFLSLVESGETESWYKAMLWMTIGSWRKLLNEAKLDVMHMVHRQYRDVLFVKERVAAGKCVQDRYGQYFR